MAEVDGKAARGMNPGDLDGMQHAATFEMLDDARYGFKPQGCYFSNVLAGRQHDVGGIAFVDRPCHDPDQPDHPAECLTAAQGDEVGSPALRRRQRPKERAAFGRWRTFRPGRDFGVGLSVDG